MSNVQQDVIDPRAGEELNGKKLQDYLRDKLPHADQKMELRQFSGGHANLTYLLTFGGQHQYVLRRPPMGPVPPHSHDMGREYKVLKGLNPVWAAAPKVFLFCDDHDIIGADFFVMERRHGTVVRKKIPPEFGGGEDPAINRTLSEVMIKALAAFHKVDYRKAGLEGLGKAQGFMKRQVRGWAGAWHRSKTIESPWAEPLIDWLKKSIPEKYNDSLIHNDWRLDNIMVDSQNPAKLVAVFDWDMCTIGEPLADVGTLLSTWLEPGESFGEGLPEIMPSTVPGFLTRDEAIELYAAQTGFDISDMLYFRVFGTYKMAMIAQQIFLRFKKGQTKDERFRTLDQACLLLLERAAGLADIR